MTKTKLTRRQFLKRSGATATLMTAAVSGGGSLMPARASINGLPDGFYVPAEEEPHERTFMQWPVNRTVHPDRWFLADLQQTIADIANTIAEFEPVVMLMSKEHLPAASRLLSDPVEVWDIPTDDLWCRDAGPLFVINDNGGLAISGIQFNGWGGKQVHGNDGEIAARVAHRLGLEIYPSGLFGEPGGVEWDGDGTLLAHESCWVNDNRNALPKAEIENRLLSAYGAEKMIWAPGVPGYDITDDHIDALARFIRPGEVIIQVPYPKDDDIFSVSARKTLSILRSATDARGRPVKISEIPSPDRTRVTSDDFVASYVNYYVCNGAVVCAQFGDPETDHEAATTLKALYPGREVIALNVDPLGETGGGIHCATQQQPKTV
ncbi:agmatine/peptidylarginine deiminase [Labrenzia sp. PHM005]|uniref:agmatine deiminase family protein n=1 Tax=Labrenzia sp. PHM005 TaxID=2590016 RepID=UPI001AD8E99C|nr:agmatine deiminase family protein [Labrenzia sp. PHM005]